MDTLPEPNFRNRTLYRGDNLPFLLISGMSVLGLVVGFVCFNNNGETDEGVVAAPVQTEETYLAPYPSNMQVLDGMTNSEYKLAEQLCAFGYMLCRDGTFRRQSLAFRYGISYGFQFEPQLTLNELRVWNRELANDYEKMGPLFDPSLEAETNLREFAAYSPIYEAQSREMLMSFCDNAGLV